MQQTLFSLCLALFLALGGCYKIDIQQGNDLGQAQIQRIQAGMSRSQVRQVLGTPSIRDPFNAERWDYVYRFFPEADESEGERRRFSVYFSGEIVARVERADETDDATP